LFWKGSGARRVSPPYVAGKASILIFIIVVAGTSSEAGKKRLQGDTMREANSSEVSNLGKGE
jgi:hypothetical protein